MKHRNEEREKRLAEALRANLRKRKASLRTPIPQGGGELSRGDGRAVEQPIEPVITPGGGVEN